MLKNLLNIRNLSPDGYDMPGLPEGVELSEAQQSYVNSVADSMVDQALKKSSMTIDGATKFIKNSGGTVFLSDNALDEKIQETLNEVMDTKIENPNKLQQSIISFKDHVTGSTLSPVDQVIKEISGIDKEEGWKTKDYVRKAAEALTKAAEGGIDPKEHNAIKTKLTEALKQVATLTGEKEGLAKSIFQNEVNGFVNRGLPVDRLDYEGVALDAIKSMLQSKVGEQFDFQKDEKGWKAINKETGEPVLNQDGTRKSPEEVINDFVLSVENLKLKAVNGGPGKPTLPGGGSGNLSEEQKKAAMEKVNEKLNEKGLIGHEKAAYVIAKEFGVLDVFAGPNLKAVQEQWPDLK